LDYLILLIGSRVMPSLLLSIVPRITRTPIEEAGRSRRGLLLGLTPLVSEPSWPPMPDQAWLRIALP
jgi:hypothetical protein